MAEPLDRTPTRLAAHQLSNLVHYLATLEREDSSKTTAHTQRVTADNIDAFSAQLLSAVAQGAQLVPPSTVERPPSCCASRAQ